MGMSASPSLSPHDSLSEDPDEDTLVWMVEATQLDDIVLVQRRAGIELDHVVEVLPGD